MARTLVLNMLRCIEAPTTGQIRDNAALVVAMLDANGDSPSVDLESLVREI